MYGIFRRIRFALFTNSYAGYFLKEEIKHSKLSDHLIEKLAKALLFNNKSLRCFIFHKTCGRKFSKIIRNISKENEKISIYLRIEKELIILIREKEDKNSLISEDYEYALLAPAIERVAGNALARIDDDGEFEKKLFELEKTYHRWYYAVAYQYKLPTLRIIPFLTRLIEM